MLPYWNSNKTQVLYERHVSWNQTLLVFMKLFVRFFLLGSLGTQNSIAVSCQTIQEAVTCSAISCNHTASWSREYSISPGNHFCFGIFAKDSLQKIFAPYYLLNNPQKFLASLHEETFKYASIRAGTRSTETTTTLTQDYMGTVDIQLKWCRMSKLVFDNCLHHYIQRAVIVLILHCF